MIPPGDMGSKRGRPWLVPVIIVFSLLVAWLVVSVATRSDGDGATRPRPGRDGRSRSDTCRGDRRVDRHLARRAPAVRRLGEPGLVGPHVERDPSRASSPSAATRPVPTTAKACPRTPRCCGRSPAAAAACAASRATRATRRRGAAPVGPANRPCGIRAARPGSRSAPTTTACTGSTAQTGATPATRLQDRRHHQGLGHRRSRRVPAPLHRVSGQLLPHHRHGSRPTDRVVQDLGLRRAEGLERRLGRLGSRHRRLPVRGRREQLVLHLQAEPRVRRGGQGHGRPAVGVPYARLGRPTTEGPRRQGGLDRELGRHLGQHGLLLEQRRPGAGLGHQRARRRQGAHAGLPLLGRRGHGRVARHRLPTASSTPVSSSNATTLGRRRSGRSSSSIPRSRTTRWCGR